MYTPCREKVWSQMPRVGSDPRMVPSPGKVAALAAAASGEAANGSAAEPGAVLSPLGPSRRASAAGGTAGNGSSSASGSTTSSPTLPAPAHHRRSSSSGSFLEADVVGGSGGTPMARRPSSGVVTGLRREVEQELIYEKLPTDIAERFVMLMDPILGSGNSAVRAIQVGAGWLGGVFWGVAVMAGAGEAVLLECISCQGAGECLLRYGLRWRSPSLLLLVRFPSWNRSLPTCPPRSVTTSVPRASVHTRPHLQPTQVLLDKGVPEHKILFLTVIAAPEGIRRICGSYPGMKVLTSEIDEGMEEFHVVPGGLRCNLFCVVSVFFFFLFCFVLVTRAWRTSRGARWTPAGGALPGGGRFSGRGRTHSCRLQHWRWAGGAGYVLGWTDN